MPEARGVLQVTNEMVKQLLNIPEEVHIISIDQRPQRGIVEFHLASEKPVANENAHYTFEMKESEVAPCVVFSMGRKETTNE